jgi:hypothetical protein
MRNVLLIKQLRCLWSAVWQMRLIGRLRGAVDRLNPDIPAQAREEASRKVLSESRSLEQGWQYVSEINLTIDVGLEKQTKGPEHPEGTRVTCLSGRNLILEQSRENEPFSCKCLTDMNLVI